MHVKEPLPPAGFVGMSFDFEVLDVITPEGRAVRLDITTTDSEGTSTITEIIHEEPVSEPDPPTPGPRRIP
jgi:hypothetical protein